MKLDFEYFYWLFQTISDDFSIISDYFRLYLTILDYFRLFPTISDFFGQFQIISIPDYFRLLLTISEHFRLFHTIADYFWIFLWDIFGFLFWKHEIYSRSRSFEHFLQLFKTNFCYFYYCVLANNPIQFCCSNKTNFKSLWK